MKKVLFLLFVSLVILVGCESAKATEYRENAEDVTKKIRDNASLVETILDDYSFIWNFSIENRSPISVEAMTYATGLEEDTIREYFEINVAGNVPNDFTSNVNSLNSYYQSIGAIGDVEEAAKEIKSIITELSEPPKDYGKVYDDLLDLYNLSEEYTDMALNPSGSLQSFNEDKNRLATEIDSKYKRIEVIMPSED